MKRDRLTRWLGGLLVTLFMAAGTGVVFADCMGPNPEPGTKPPWAGTICPGDEVLEFAVSEYDPWPHEGPANGADNETGQGDQDRTRDDTTHD